MSFRGQYENRASLKGLSLLNPTCPGFHCILPLTWTAAVVPPFCPCLSPEGVP